MLCSLWFSVRCACAIEPPNNDPCDVYLKVKTKLENKLQEKNITLEVRTDKDLKAKPKVTLVFVYYPHVLEQIFNMLWKAFIKV